MDHSLAWRDCEHTRSAADRATAHVWSNVSLITQPVKKDLETRGEVSHNPNSDEIEV